ncbi:hypothetical protein [Cohnella sp. AR92]|uniref:hypothetical protein n=1 Tax=Cohnella sp. AR92 TaxID=648716 RepID=UPI000F8CF999|nr:hypothetical protein [Cohnella sp. AR92]RUS44588.1 hypothetical protein ELR57_22660 [Cohnella sp. AR92]
MITVRADGNAVIVDFGDIIIKIPTGYAIPISEVSLGEGGVVFFLANGEEDFISIGATVFGEEPRYIPFEYSIVFDEHNIGITGLCKLTKRISANNWSS